MLIRTKELNVFPIYWNWFNYNAFRQRLVGICLLWFWRPRARMNCYYFFQILVQKVGPFFTERNQKELILDEYRRRRMLASSTKCDTHRVGVRDAIHIASFYESFRRSAVWLTGNGNRIEINIDERRFHIKFKFYSNVLLSINETIKYRNFIPLPLWISKYDYVLLPHAPHPWYQYRISAVFSECRAIDVKYRYNGAGLDQFSSVESGALARKDGYAHIGCMVSQCEWTHRDRTRATPSQSVNHILQLM